MPFISFPAENRAPGRKKGAEQVRLHTGKGREGAKEEPWAGWGARVSREQPGDSERQGGLWARPVPPVASPWSSGVPGIT